MGLEAFRAFTCTAKDINILTLTTLTLLSALTRQSAASKWDQSRLYDRDLAALAAIYPYFCNSCLEQIWPNSSRDTWSLSVDPCGTSQTWFGVGCAEDAHNPGKFTVTSLILRGRLATADSLVYPNPALLADGEFPPAIGELRNLTKLDLSNNFLGGRLPQWLAGLPRLQELILANNLVSVIPPEIGNMARLRQLDMSNNELGRWATISIPDSLARLKSLRYLDVSHNGLQGDIPSCIAGMESLSHLDLSFNFLQGTLPPWLGQLRRLKFLDLQSNGFTGPLPAHLDSVRHLYVGENAFCSNQIGAPCQVFPALMTGLVVACAACGVLFLGCLCGTLRHCRQRRVEEQRERRLNEGIAALALALEAGTIRIPPPREEQPKDDPSSGPESKPQFPVYMDGRLIGLASGESSGTDACSADSCPPTPVDMGEPLPKENETLLVPRRTGPEATQEGTSLLLVRTAPIPPESNEGAREVSPRSSQCRS